MKPKILIGFPFVFTLVAADGNAVFNCVQDPLHGLPRQ